MKYRGYLYVPLGVLLLWLNPLHSIFFQIVHVNLIAIGIMLICKERASR